jgi:hypothetical protein
MFSNFLIIGGTIEDVTSDFFSKIYLSNLVSVQRKKDSPKKIYVSYLLSTRNYPLITDTQKEKKRVDINQSVTQAITAVL